MQIFRLTNRGRGKWECQVACRPIFVFFLAHRKSAQIQTALKEIMRKQNCRVRENAQEKRGEKWEMAKMRREKGQKATRTYGMWGLGG